MISVVIATLNNERTLSACLAALVPAAVDAIVTEVIVVDGGSTDATPEIADDAGAKRADSVAAAVAAAKCDWVLILPATLRLETGWDAEAAAHLQTAGGQGARFRSATWRPFGGGERAVMIRRDRFGQRLIGLKRLDSRAYAI